MEGRLKLKLLAHTPNPDTVVAKGGRLCYYPGGIEELEEDLSQEKVGGFVSMLAEMQHESPLEHAVFTFGIEGVSRSLTHQLVRHRLASYSQKSQRYVREGSFEYIIPKKIQENIGAKETFIRAMEDIQRAYDNITRRILAQDIRSFYQEQAKESLETIEKLGDDELLEDFRKHYKKDYNRLEKLAIENARAVLPNACETKIIVTMNARILLHFFRKRCCNRAQEEIRSLAIEMLKLVKAIGPNIFRYAGPQCVYGDCPEGRMTCGKAEEVREYFRNI